jgi:ferredoxin
MRFEVDVDKCVGAGVCALAAPSVFDQNDDDGIVVVLDENPPASQDAAVREAAERCPAAVIRLQAFS